MLFMLLKAVETVDFTELVAVEVVDFIPLQTLPIVECMAFITVEIIFDIVFHMVVITLFMAFKTVEILLLIESQTEEKVPLIEVSILEKKSEIAVQMLWAVFFIPFKIPEKKLLMLSHMFSKKSFMLLQHSSQLVPNQPRTVSNIPFIVSRTAESMPFIPSQIPENISLIPVHACSQSPVNMPINTSNIPVRTSRTVERTVATAEKAPSNMGARRLQNSVHIFFIPSTTSPKPLKLIPSADSLSFMQSAKSVKVFFMLFHMAVTFSLNSSFVFQRVTKAATSVPITATTATTGADIPPIAVTSLPMVPVPVLA